METQKKRKAVTGQQPKTEEVTGNSAMVPGDYRDISASQIDFSPFNYRKAYDPVALGELADDLGQHGMIAPVTVRKMPTGRYELVSGERRLRAAALAGLSEIPAMVRDLTDDEVIEIQLSENMQREDPHPLHESFAIAGLLKAGKTTEEIAIRLGKSKAFIYSRIKLSALIDPLQEMFLADKFNIKKAFEIASLSGISQQEFFDEHCTEWQEKDFRIYDLHDILSNFKYDLNEAPFNVKDKKLVPEAGACTGCAFNSATLKTLFPEFAQKATCTNKACYKNKCTVHLKSVISGILKEHGPDALLLPYHIPQEVNAIIEDTAEIKELPRHEHYDVTKYHKPTPPEKEDFADIRDPDGNETPGFDREGYNQALEEYKSDIVEYEALEVSGKALKGIYISGFNATLVLFGTDRKLHDKPNITAKEVQQAIKAGTATPELLQQEVERIGAREKRAKELDREKVQLTLHESYRQQFGEPENCKTLTAADLAAAKLLVFKSLDHSIWQQLASVLFPGMGSPERFVNEEGYNAIASLTDEQYCYLIRMAIAGKSESKYPNNLTAYCLHKVAVDAGLDVAAIEQEQQEKADTRQARLRDRVKDLERRMETPGQETASQ